MGNKKKIDQMLIENFNFLLIIPGKGKVIHTPPLNKNPPRNIWSNSGKNKRTRKNMVENWQK